MSCWYNSFQVKMKVNNNSASVSVHSIIKTQKVKLIELTDYSNSNLVYNFLVNLKKKLMKSFSVWKCQWKQHWNMKNINTFTYTYTWENREQNQKTTEHFWRQMSYYKYFSSYFLIGIMDYVEVLSITFWEFHNNRCTFSLSLFREWTFYVSIVRISQR